MPIQQNTALFSLLGTTYGGNGTTTFGLPDLRGRAALHPGQGPGLTNYSQGTLTGTESVTLLATQMPAHTHAVDGATLPFKTNNAVTGNNPSPVDNFLAKSAGNQYGEEATTLTMLANSVTGTASAVGNNVAHENRMPHLAMYYIIATEGIYPQRP